MAHNSYNLSYGKHIFVQARATYLPELTFLILHFSQGLSETAGGQLNWFPLFLLKNLEGSFTRGVYNLRAFGKFAQNKTAADSSCKLC